MINTLLGIKKGMTATYDARGRRVGATIISVEPNLVTQLKNSETKDGYGAVQIAIGEKKSVKKPQIGHFKKAGSDKKLKFVREVRMSTRRHTTWEDNSRSLTDASDLKAGQELKVTDVFRVGDAVKVSGISKGLGFQGVVRRHGFHGGPKTHGQSDRHRSPGSIGAGTTPGRVLRGKKMAGHMGFQTVTLQGLEIVAIDRINNLLTLKGGVPGPNGGLLTIQNLGKIKGYTPPPEEKEDEEEEKSDEGNESNEGDKEGERDRETEGQSEEPKAEEAAEEGDKKDGD